MAKNDNLKDFLTDVADAIRAKKGTTDLINPQDFSAEIASIETGGGSVESKSVNDVTFYDYDGTVLHSYTKDEFLAMSAMPELPTREGLICQEWNWSFEDAIAYVSKYGILNVGATYITDDGKTRFYITIPSKVVSEITLYFSLTTPNSLVIDWGDGKKDTISDSGELNATHSYDTIGDYVISLEVAEGCKLQFTKSLLGSGRPYLNMLKKAEIGNRVTSINSAFKSCYSLSSIVIPQGVTTMRNALESCVSLPSVVIPQGVTDVYNTLYGCYSLSSVVIPNSITYIGHFCYYCHSLSSIVIPQGVTRIDSSAFYYCDSLSSIVIPQGVTRIDSYTFNSCTSLVILDFSESTSVPTLSSSNAIPTQAELRIVVPDSLYDEWIAATNWSSHASQIIKKSDWDASQA